MSVHRFDPLAEFDRFSQGLLGTMIPRPGSIDMGAYKNDNEFVIEFDLPGVDPENITLDIERNSLTVSGSRSFYYDDEVNVLTEDRSSGSFRRQVVLSDDLDKDNATAEYVHGVLRVTIPLSQKSSRRRVPIDTGDKDREVKEIES